MQSTLVDYGRSLWRRKWLVALGLALGLVLGLLVLPKLLPNTSTYQATTRMNVQPFTADELLPSSNGSSSSGKTGLTPGQSAALTDATTVEALLKDLGTRAKDLSVLKGVPSANWTGVVAKAIKVSPVANTPYMDVAFSDSDQNLASQVVSGYAQHYVTSRNAQDDTRVNAALGRLTAQATGLKQQVTILQNKSDAERAASSRFQPSVATTSQLGIVTKQYTDMQTQITNIKYQQSLLGKPTSIVAPVTASLVNSPISRKLVLILSIMLGLLLGIGLALLLDGMRPRVVTPDDVEQAMGRPVIGVIPRSGLRGRGLTVTNRPLSPAAEGIQRARGALQLRGFRDDFSILAVLSADKKEGKSTFAANLAQSLAADGRDVVLVSGDLRRPGVEMLLGLERGPGLAELLQGTRSNPAELLVSVASHLLVLPAGVARRNPAELMLSPRLREVTQELRDLGLLVILDTPPARWAADATALASVADGAVIVVRSGRSRWRTIERLAQDLGRNNIRMLGVVLMGSREFMLNTRYSRYGSYSARDAAVEIGKPRQPEGSRDGSRSAERV